jgi:hypothetical protein
MNPQNKKVIQADLYEIIELHANGQLQMIVQWNAETKTMDSIVAGPMSLASTEPGIIRALREEELLDG